MGGVDTLDTGAQTPDTGHVIPTGHLWSRDTGNYVRKSTSEVSVANVPMK